jgi:hypothetical protein
MGSIGRSLGVRGRSLVTPPEPLDGGGALDGKGLPLDTGGALDGAGRPLGTGGGTGRPLDTGARLLDAAGLPLDAGARLLDAAGLPLDAGGRLLDAAGRPLDVAGRSLSRGFGGTDGASSTAKPPGYVLASTLVRSAKRLLKLPGFGGALLMGGLALGGLALGTRTLGDLEGPGGRSLSSSDVSTTDAVSSSSS